MNDVLQLRKEIARLEVDLERLKRQLAHLQKACAHEFVETPLARTCAKCLQTESLYY
ncbi:hypothetical protein BAG01nite_05010 [Brevibacillus agri]|uniref:Serine protease n=1 Tax=Brevibacillus agri TaxID=51101 RepID=A0ABQ0SKL2_9BACL|nr:hypothetical protein [Brevibacillus agri]MBY0053939.1 hypothetical protein [Brevibacillus agri]MCG5253042.1 DUF4349 domain-containing protein [Brevibacillus agri]MDN4092348.1 hypothetical protein [Brevibacillus agri]MDR9503426.1 hypothetical protein [Brevibacillus agri]MED1643387.1 hypothetical protein [Brevibacillus agri]